jgi:two-component sensor histidine kinase
LITYVDITNVIRAEEHEKTLVWELNQRVKNTLNAVISIATETLRRSTTLEGFSSRMFDRLNAVVRASEILARRDGQSTLLQDLVGSETGTFTKDNVRRINLRGGPVALSSKATLVVGMALHELASNAAQYGALSVDNGHIDVRWSLKAGNGDRVLEIDWSEHGGPRVGKRPSKAGFGIELIERGVPLELGGSTKLAFRRSGLHCVIRIPAANAVKTDGE